MGTLHGSWIWYELVTPDPGAAKAFYEEVVGWTMAPGSPETGDYGFVTAPDGAMVGGVLRLMPDSAEHGLRPGWLGYVGVNDCDAAARQVTERGGTVLMPPRDVPMAGRIALVADPGGAPFYLMTPAPPPGGGESTAFQPDSKPGHCGWNELLAGDARREIAFYTGLLNWSLPDAMDMGAMGQYQFIAHDGVTVGAIMPAMPQTPAPFWNHYFWVPSVSAAKARIEAAGGQIANGPHQVPGGGWIVSGIDPQGAFFSLVGEH